MFEQFVYIHLYVPVSYTHLPVESFTGNLSLEFGEYSFDEPRYSIKGCEEKNATYAAPLKVEARLFNQETGEVTLPRFTKMGSFRASIPMTPWAS